MRRGRRWRSSAAASAGVARRTSRRHTGSQRMEAETHYADSGGVSIAYQVHGERPGRSRPGSGLRLPCRAARRGPRDRPLPPPPRLLLAPARLRQARAGPLRPARPAADPGGVDGRPARGRGGGRLRAPRGPGSLRGRADVGALRGHLSGRGLGADPLRDLRADGGDRRLPAWDQRRTAGQMGVGGPPRLGRPGRARHLGAEPGRRRRVRTLVGAAPAPGDEPGRGDRPDGPLPGDGRARDPAGDRRPDPGPPPRRRPDDLGRPGPVPGGEYPRRPLVELPGNDHLPFAGDVDAHPRRGRGVPRRQPRDDRVRTGAGDDPLHRHRRLDREGGRAGRPGLAGSCWSATTPPSATSSPSTAGAR